MNPFLSYDHMITRYSISPNIIPAFILLYSPPNTHILQNAAEAVGEAFRDLSFADPRSDQSAIPDDDTIDLPPYACCYCGIHNPASVVKCLTTNKWFCNGRTLGSTSCIIAHLVKGRYRDVSLHKMSPLGETILECYASGNRNVFALGYVPLLDENTVVLLARDTLASSPALKDLNLDITQWQPLIQDRAFVDWLVRHPSPEELRQSRKLTMDEISRLEELWKSGSTNAILADLTFLPEKEDETLPVALRYDDVSWYEGIFAPLIKLEAEYDKATKESQKRDGVTVHWSLSLNKRHIGRFYFPKDASDLRIMVGDELRLKHPCPRFGQPAWQGTGVVVRLDALSEEVVLEMYYGSGRAPRSASAVAGGKHGRRRDKDKADAAVDDLIASRGAGTGVGGKLMAMSDSMGADLTTNRAGSLSTAALDAAEAMAASNEDSRGPPPTDVSSGFSVEYVWKGTSFERMITALRSFSQDETSVSGYLYHSVLGHEVPKPTVKTTPPKRLTAPGLPDLNHSQLEAVHQVLMQPLSLIQGPPGTGKTVTSATIVYHLAKQGQGQVLVTAPSNIAVDHLADRISLTGLRVVRLQAKSREEVSTTIQQLTLQHQVRNLDVPDAAELRKLQLLREELGELSHSDERRYRNILRMLEKMVLHSAEVVCCTCVGAGDPRLNNFRFRRVLIDEATQAVEPEALIPLMMGCKQAILVGDHCQLGPVIVNKKAAHAGLSQSLFERLMLLGVRPIRLAVQYRMHPALSAFPSNIFYEGALQNGVSAVERSAPGVEFPWPVPTRPLMFWSQLGAEEISPSGTSYLNRTEAAAVEKAVTALLKGGVDPEQIGIVTPYEGQRAHVLMVMMRHGPLKQSLYAAMEVSSVDSFQGREKDYIILSCVRSNEHQGIGFLSDSRRMNVALTRARYGLIVLGNPRVLSKQAVWRALLTHFKEEEVLVEGPLTALKPCMVNLGRQTRQAFDAGVLYGSGALFSSRYRPVEKAGDKKESTTTTGGGGGGKRGGPSLGGMMASYPYAIPSDGGGSGGGSRRSGHASSGRIPLTQSSMATQLEYGTQGTMNLSQGSMMNGGFHSQGTNY